MSIKDNKDENKLVEDEVVNQEDEKKESSVEDEDINSEVIAIREDTNKEDDEKKSEVVENEEENNGVVAIREENEEEISSEKSIIENLEEDVKTDLNSAISPQKEESEKSKIKDNASAFMQSSLKIENRKLTQKDFEFMNSLSAATMQMQSKKLHWVLVSFFVTIFTFIIWAAFADIDEISRGNGKVVPSGQNQILQNLEGGIISEILVKEGDFVEKGQVLIRINNEKSQSSLASNALKTLALEAQTLRLQAEFEGLPFEYDFKDNPEMEQFIKNEKNVYLTNQKQLKSQVDILLEQKNQKLSQLEDGIQSQKHLEISLDMINQEVKMTEPMVKRGIRSQVDFLKLQREENDATQKFNSATLTIEKTKSEIKEIEKKILEIHEAHKVKVGEEFSQKLAELKEIEATSSAYEDQVLRTTVRSPSNGLVQKLYVNTIGGAVKPAQELVEIVPTDNNLIVEIKILPSDIAFIYLGQKSIVKFSAYDFAIYGGLNGKVINISADTITDKEENTFYLVRIQTDKNYLGSETKPMKIIPGMIADADIITGKKSVLDYILKPILKTKQYTFTER